jgi:glycosyltransferase involved in cell wall biosynthesis
MRVLLVFETLYPDTIGGVEHRNAELAAALARRGHDVVVAGLGSPRARVAGVETVALGPVGRVYNAAGKRNAWHAVRFALAMRRLDVRSFDVVEAANMHYLYLWPLARACRGAGVPLLVTWYEYWRDYWRGYVGPLLAPLCRAIEHRAAQIGNQVAATSALTADRLARARGGERIPILPCGIDTRRAAEAAARADPEATPLVYAGRLIEHKRVDLLLEAVAVMDRPGPLLTIFGDGPARPQLEARAASLGLAERVCFRGFVQSSRQVWQTIAGSRVAVQPSAREGFGLFPLEALSVGVPLVYCDSQESAVGELIRDGVEGRRCAPDPRALASCLTEMLADGSSGSPFRAACLARAAEYDWSRVAAAFEEVTRRALPTG